ncbi:hypothetical protein D9V28_04880 [Mycetocola zhadangensis]|uniref:NAD glycohydrolase translocation F5/8 type C domain-containing protein n=2 Tax=Mycetocola zhadangensis TaxID=1164595 RepID=A0A3L7JCF6_9MICO|nr:hypothetical protein D9V28_04880 [Mycetocola zhadangensis]
MKKASVAVGVAAGLVTILAGVTAIVGAFSSSRVANAPTCNDPGSLKEVAVEGLVASSELAEPPIVHSASRLIDGNLNRAWVEGAEGYGVGEQLDFTFDEPVDLKLICVVNGYAGTLAQYEKNARVGQFEITTQTGTSTDSLGVKAPSEYANAQELEFQQGMTATVRLVLTSARPGTGANATEDTSISEVTFWASTSD